MGTVPLVTIIRLRTELADERGRLGRLASAIAACRGNILGVDVHYLDGGRVADEFVVEFPDGGSGAALATALRRAGGATVDVERLDVRAVTDPVARATDIAAGLFAPGPPDRRLTSCVTALLRADQARLVDEEEALASDAWARALRGHAPTVDRGADHLEGRWVLVVPDVGGARRRVLVVERTAPRFSASEVARAAALVRLADAARRPIAPLAVDPPTAVRPRRGSVFLRRSTGAPAAGVPA